MSKRGIISQDFPWGLIAEEEARYEREIESASHIVDLLAGEGRHTKWIYRIMAESFGIPDFKREKNESSDLLANEILTHLNYLAYGAAAVSLHIMGIGYSFPLMHGKTRRGALVFDIADIVKDGLCVPLAFYGDRMNLNHTEAKSLFLDLSRRCEVITIMCDEIKRLCNLDYGEDR